MCSHEFVWFVAEESTRLDVGHFMLNLLSLSNCIWHYKLILRLAWCFWFSANDSFCWTSLPIPGLAQLCTISHALVSTLQKHQSKTSKLIRFGSLPFRNNWGWQCTTVRMWLICSKRKLYHKKQSFCYRDTTKQSFFHTLPDHLHCTNRPLTYVLRKDMSTLSRRSKRRPLRKNVLNEISRKSKLNRLLDWSFAMGASQSYNY